MNDDIQKTTHAQTYDQPQQVADKVPAGANKNGSKVLFIRLLIPTEK
jgi:hypothetical protein